MPLSDYVEGLAWIGATLAGAGAGSALVLRRRLTGLAGAPHLLAGATLFAVWLIGVHLLPGALGLLERWAVAATAIASAIAAWRLVRPAARPAVAEPPAPPPASGLLSRAIALLAVGGLGAYVLAHVWKEAGVPTFAIDALTFHQPDVARWIQTGSFWQVDQFTPDLAHGNYPQNGNVLQLAVTLPWSSAAFARWAAMPFLGIAAVAVYACAVELRAPRASAAAFAAAFAAVPVALLPAIQDGQTDAVMLAGFGTGILFLLRHLRAGRGADLALAGLALGLAFGTKWYGVSCVAAVVALWALASLFERRAWRRVAGDVAALAGLVAAAGGFWLLRNLVESGNPLMPVKVELGGITVFDAPPDPVLEAAGYTLLDYATEPSVWSDYLLPAFERSYDLAGVALVGGAVAALGAFVLRREEADRRLALVAAAAVALALVYAITPYSALGPEGRPVQADANTRYGVPALLVAAVLAACGAGALGRLRPAAELVALAGVAGGVARAFDLPRGQVAAAGVALVLLAAAGWALTRVRPGPLRAAALAAAVVALAAVGWVAQRDYHDAFYEGRDAVIDRVLAAPEGTRVGLGNVWSNEGLVPVLPSFGERLRNEVDYVGAWVDGVLREHRSQEGFTSALEGHDLLVLGLGSPPEPPVEEEAWLRTAGWSEVARSDRLALWRPASDATTTVEPR